MFSANENIQLRKYKKQIVEWVEQTMDEAVLDTGVNVMVMQVTCTAPGCVPLETVILIVFPTSSIELIPGLACSAGGNYKTKILKPMSSVTQHDVLEALPGSAFIGGLRDTEKLYIQARDIMLGQITQLIADDNDVTGKILLAQYLQQSLQDYIDRNCTLPEWGQPFPPLENLSLSETDKQQQQPPPPTDEATTQPNNATPVQQASNEQPQPNDTITTNTNTPVSKKNDTEIDAETNNSINKSLLQPTITDNSIDVQTKNRNPIVDTANVLPTISSSNSVLLSTASPPARTISSTTPTQPALSSYNTTGSSIQTSVRQRQQHQATRYLNGAVGSSSSASLLARLAEREINSNHRMGCPCCDNDNPNVLLDSMMKL